VGSRSTLVNKPLPIDDPKVRQPDISKAINRLSWHPQVSLEEGLSLTIQDFETRLNRKNERS
jgi:nucleoside-diphosphate-sugar epimerase